MRIVIWNCFRGTPATRMEELSHLTPDITVLTEARDPVAETDRIAFWSRPEQLGTAVVTQGPYTVERLPMPEGGSPCAVPCRIMSPHGGFNLLAVWTFREPTYSEALAQAIDAHEPFIRSAPTIIAGDFNSNAIWDEESRAVNHTINDARLRAMGLQSAYHAFTKEELGSETAPTLYFQWKQERPFHIDYCYLPTEWPIKHVMIPGFDQFTSSDHRPLIVDVPLPLP